MADIERADQQQHPNLNLTPEERRYFGQLFAAADTDKLGVVTGEVAVKFFEKTRLSSDVLGEIWQIADTENRGLLTPSGFGIVLRLIGYAQGGRTISSDLAIKPGGPLPKFDGIALPPGPQAAAPPLQAQNTEGPIRVPPLTQEKVTQFSKLFEESGAQNGLLSGVTAKSIFERAQLPNEVLGRIWSLADTEQKGALGLTEFIIAMHLLTSFRNGSLRALPQILPAGLYEAAARRGPPRQATGSRPTSDLQGAAAIPRQFSGASFTNQAKLQSPTQTGDQWAISPQDKAQFDSIYATVDTQNRGFITGDQAVGFFSNARLPEETLAQIWDLADINSEGRLSQDEFAVAMYLIRQQRAKRDSRESLPQVLPPNLMPPSMRRQPIAPQQPTAPAFNNSANITKPKSAADDLFGLEAISTPTHTPSKALPDDGNFVPSSPTRNQVPPSPQAAAPTPSHFKPFIPTSSFGQTIMTPQDTGTSSTASPAQTRSIQQGSGPRGSAMDDLLGDNDAEVSKKLNSDTTELANLSNQVSTLTNKMVEVKTNRGNVEQDLGRAQAQKRDFEARLGQLRSAYQQEVKEVQALEEQLRVSKEDTRKLQSEIALIEGTHHDLRNQHVQFADALAADQAENARLKEKISQTNIEINELKPRLEKAKMDARQQKGLVAIYKKQLAGSENERESIRGEIDTAVQEHAESLKEADESKRAAEALAESTRRAAPTAASPAPSSGSLNPFFRRNSSAANRQDITSPLTPPSVSSPNHNAFDSFFGPSPPATSAPPPTSFKTQTPLPQTPSEVSRSTNPALSHDSSEDANIPTPSASPPPPSNFSDSPHTASEPPAPPQSRQITSSFLPLRPNLENSGSETDSVRVIPPASRMGEDSVSGAETPTHFANEDKALGESPKQHFEELAAKRSLATSLQADTSSHPAGSLPPETSETRAATDLPTISKSSGIPNLSQDVPGAFPGDDLPEKEEQGSPFASSASPYNGTKLDPRVDALLPSASGSNLASGTESVPRTEEPNSAKVDFDSAFAGLKDSGKEADSTRTAEVAAFPSSGAGKSKGEFPPIREFGDEDDSDSEEEKGFEDSFAPSAAKNGKLPVSEENRNSSPGLTPRPPLASADSNHSQLPTPGAQASPPTYDQTVKPPSTTGGGRKDSNQFPAEYMGLLPSRENPISPPLPPPESLPRNPTAVPSTAGIDRGLNFFGTDSNEFSSSNSASPFAHVHSPMAPGASTAAPFAYTQNNSSVAQSKPAIPPKEVLPRDDFEDEFGDLTEAKEASDKGDDDIPFSGNRTNDLEDFNPVFDSPAPSRFTAPGSQSSVFPQTDSFADFQASPAAHSATTASMAAGPSANSTSSPEAPSHDWDAIFAGLDTPKNNGVGGDLDFSPQKQQPQPQQLQQQLQQQPLPPRNGTAAEGSKKGPTTAAGLSEEASDDPILKRLTGMGYPRDQSLKALEKYDYNLDRAAEYLISRNN